MKYPKSSNKISDAQITSQPAYVSWDSDDKAEVTKAFETYSQSLGEHAIANVQRDFSGLTNYADGRPGLRASDFDWFRPGQAAPVKPKDIIAFARYAYRRIGLIHNAIDLMGDFAAQGIRLVHPNKRIERFYNNWFEEVQGKRVSERLGHLLFREANVPIRWYTAKVNKNKRTEMQRSIAASDISADIDKIETNRNEIPWRYTFLDPILVDPVGGPLANLSKDKVLTLSVPLQLQNQIKRLQNASDTVEGAAAKEVLGKISPDIIRAVNGNGKVLLPPEKTSIYYYKKDDWQTWADPMTYSAFEPLNLYQRLQLTDKAALDGAMNKIRVWKIGSLEHKLAPTPTASSTLADMLGANVGGGTIDIVWGPDIDLLETSSDIQSYLGEEKYKPTLMAIYSALGIPPTLTGTFGSSGTTNNFIALKTLVERLNYVRQIIIDFWKEQIKIVQKAMGFRQPAIVEFDIMYLEDPAAMTTLLLNMADRNIISDEFVQRHVKATPDIENRRVQKENISKEEKVSPYHQVDQEYGLKKIALQTGVSSPSEVGLELEEKKEGEQNLVEIREQNKNPQPSAPQQENNSGEPGRPKNSNDSSPRKERVFQPKLKASAEIWAKKAQDQISELANPALLNFYSKSSLRNLNLEEFRDVERVKFEILCNLDIGQTIDNNAIAHAAKKPIPHIHLEFESWVSEAEEQLGKLTVEQIRDMRVSYFVYYKYGN